MTELSSSIHNVLDTDCARTVGEFLAEAGDAEFDGLIEALKDATQMTASERQRAVYLLGRIGRPEAVEAIITAIPGLDDGGRVAAADALGRLGGNKARSAVLKLSKDADPQVRKFSAAALSRLGGTRARQRLQQITEEDQEDFVRLTARRRLQRMP